MDEVLQKLNLDHFIENFKEQKISGIVCKLSSQDLEILGITNKQDVMSLRIACSVYGERSPIKLSSHCRAPKFFIQNLSFAICSRTLGNTANSIKVGVDNSQMYYLGHKKVK